ncbi:hypothetical protein lerEdw1_007449 [Lerista edwardsae]|nr:hypothetical protein lerEdw1_007449 [Lerista edwardsae]
MAPKKAKSKEKKLAKEQSVMTMHLTDKEQYLQKEHDILTEHVNNYTQRMENFQKENESLDKEALEIRENTKAFIVYLNKHKLRRQNSVITLNGQNQEDLEEVQKQKEELLSQYMDKEKEVKCQLSEMEIKYNHMNEEIEKLQPYKDLQSTYQTRIRELEKELLTAKIQHSEHMQRVKTRFLQQKAEYEIESQEKVEALAKRAEKEAVRSLIKHTKRIKAENRQLREDLMSLIQRAQHLRAFMSQLLEKREQLRRELQYSRDLSCLRPWLTQKGASSSTSLRSQLSAKGRPRSYHVISVLPPIEKEAGAHSRSPLAARSLSKARIAKSSSVLALLPEGKDSLEFIQVM